MDSTTAIIFKAKDWRSGELTPFRLVASHTGTEPVNGPKPTPAENCPGCGTKRKVNG